MPWMLSAVAMLTVTACLALPPDEAPAAREAWAAIEARIAALDPRISELVPAADTAAFALINGANLAVVASPALALDFALKPGGLQWYHGSTDGEVHFRIEGEHLVFATRQAESFVATEGDLIATPALAWAWKCELFAAFTRHRRVPVVRRSPELDTRHTWQRRYGDQRFHDDRWLEPIPPQSLGRAYIHRLRATLRDVGTVSWRPLADAAWRARHTIRDGGTVFVRATGYPATLVRPPFVPLDHDGSDPSRPRPGPDDFVIALGTSEPAGGSEWGEPELLRDAGRGVAWVVSGYNTKPRDVLPNELLVDLWTPVGECAVDVPHYDADLGPVSSIVAAAVLHTIHAHATSVE